MIDNDAIQYFDRQSNSIQYEKVYGDKAVRWLYNSRSGNFVLPLLTRPYLSKLYGIYQNSFLSTYKIPSFINDFAIRMEDFELSNPNSKSDYAKAYSSFNDFFTRKLKKDARPIEERPNLMPAFAEARYLGYPEWEEGKNISVKANNFSLKQLLNNDRWSRIFNAGPVLVARLSPVDYHRFHFPDDVEVLDYYKVAGPLHSVNPVAIKFRDQILAENERQITIFESKNFGKLAYIEVGALCVGKIVQSHSLSAGHKFQRGQEKGYFLFGGSTVILVGEKGRWVPSADILEHSSIQKIETLLRLGDQVAQKN